jgi:hypothetical protein
MLVVGCRSETCSQSGTELPVTKICSQDSSKQLSWTFDQSHLSQRQDSEGEDECMNVL